MGQTSVTICDTNFFSKTVIQGQNAAINLIIAAFILYHQGVVQEWYKRYKKSVGTVDITVQVQCLQHLVCATTFWDIWDSGTRRTLGTAGQLGHVGQWDSGTPESSLVGCCKQK